MHHKIILHDQDGNPTIEPLATSLLIHSASAAFRDIAPGDEQRIRIGPSQRVADEWLRDVPHQNGLLRPHTMRANPASLRVSKDDTNRNAQHAAATHYISNRCLTASDGRPG